MLAPGLYTINYPVDSLMHDIKERLERTEAAYYMMDLPAKSGVRKFRDRLFTDDLSLLIHDLHLCLRAYMR